MDLEDELNRLFKDERLDMRAAPDAETHVVAGAKRVKRRRVAMMSAAGVLSAAVLAGGAFVLAQPSPQSSQMANQPTDLPVDNPSSAPSQAPPSSTTTEMSTLPSAPSATSRPVEPTPGTVRNPPSATSTTVPPIAPAATLGPNGFGKMRLGMTEDELLATGQVQATQKPPTTGCTSYATKTAGGTVWVSPDSGVVGFVFRSGVATPERVGIGSTLDAVKTAYPDFSGNSAKVPGNASAKYQFSFTGGKVSGLNLLAAQQDCVS
ncbi:hypothetical protein DMH04_49200 [Kibdelosporangium aridum]|uniref:Uncharacterized protein n=1 Tax=Kibdelosporangium aridum TaxID=2030 RepID=A0A428YCY5_KIBAR|nr:hypothetical protein [Kibdelosporangium aridum]RSM65340.1 hypothetical protein DMH04_49200 [Kibdelosporangium aridum]